MNRGGEKKMTTKRGKKSAEVRTSHTITIFVFNLFIFRFFTGLFYSFHLSDYSYYFVFHFSFEFKRARMHTFAANTHISLFCHRSGARSFVFFIIGHV